ncbi:hypothetical protein ACFL96_12730 [Thermoproteota archaeon]
MSTAMRILPLGIMLMVFSLSIPTGMYLQTLNISEQIPNDFISDMPEISNMQKQITSGIDSTFLFLALVSISVASFLYWKRR